MANNLKRILAAIMAMSMTFGLLSVGATATEEGGTETIELESVTLPEAISVPFGTELDEVLEKLGTEMQATVKAEEDDQEPDSSEGTDPAEGTEPSEGTDDPAEGTELTEDTDLAESTESTENKGSVESTEELAAVAVSYSGPETVQVPVTWSCTTEGGYDGWTAGSYTFKATLSEGYIYNEPINVEVTVQSQPTYVAQIVNGEKYTTLDDAIEAASAGDTIELLANCKATKTFSKSLTFTGSYTMSMDVYGWRYKGDLVFDGVNFVLNSDSDSPEANNGEAARWFVMVLSGAITAQNGANVTFAFDSASGTNCAIYADNGATINVKDGSAFKIYGQNTRGITGQGIQLDSTAGTGIFVTGNSEFLIDGTNRGYVNSPSVYVEDSTFTVQNCTSNASNGGLFTAKNSTINFEGNAVLGLSADSVTSEHSIFNLNNNGFSGLYLSGKSTFDGSSEVYITGNCTTSFAGYGAFFVGGETIFESGSVLSVIDNDAGGIRVTTGYGGTWAPTTNSSLTVQEGADLTITGNRAYRESDSDWSEAYGGNAYGGGIWTNTAVSVPSDAKIYNNHAATAGDDIYLSTKKANKVENKPVSEEATPSITFGSVGSDWVLDDCNDAIDGWYQDGAGHRWSAHSAPLYAYEFTGYGEAVTGTLALKAAHGLIPVGPDDPEAPNWQISKSKTATNLDDNYESQVTLSLPAAGYERTMDVVLVIDDTHAGSVIFEDAVNSLLDELAEKDTMDIKVGVVAFDAVSRDWLSATSNGAYSGLVSIRDAGALTALKNAVSTQLDYSGEGSMKKVGGTNTEWAVDMASEILSTGTGEDKYLIMFSDLYGYMYRGDLTIDDATYHNVPLSKRIGTWREGSMSMGTKYETFADAYAHRNDPDNQTVDGFFRDSSWNSYWSTYGEAEIVPENTIADAYQVGSHTFSGFEKSMCLTYDNLAHAAGQAKVIIVNNSFPTGDALSAQAMVQEMLDALEEGGYIKTYRYVTHKAEDALTGNAASGIFTGIREDLIQLVDEGSKVVDVIGSGSDYNFDFVNDISKLTMTVNGQELEKTAISATSYGFGGTGTDYDFVVTYYADGQNGRGDECFVWEINVPVTKEAPVQLTYSVKLTHPKTTPGTYGQYDANGSQGYTGLYTNNSAVLYPVDSNGEQGFPESFAKPTVSYTVSGGGGGTSYDYYTVTVNYLDQDSGEKIAQSYVSGSIREGRSYDVTAYDAIAIEGYTYVETTGDPLTGTMNGNKVINVYYTTETDLDDGDTPLGPGPDDGTDIPDGDVPQGDGTEIIDGETPMGDLPQTGTAEAVNPFATAGLMALAMSMAAAGLFLTRKQGKREED